MHLECHYQAELEREDYYHYIRTVDIAVKGYDADLGHEYTVGRLVIDKIRWQDALIDGVSLFEVCDADSQGLYEVHRALSDPDNPQELRRDLEIHEVVDEVLFVHRVLLHPEITDRIAVFHGAVRAITNEDALVVMWTSTPYNTRFTEKELVALGFAKIAGEELVYSDLHFTTPFDKESPCGRDVGLAATPEHQKWIEEHWERDEEEGISTD